MANSNCQLLVPLEAELYHFWQDGSFLGGEMLLRIDHPGLHSLDRSVSGYLFVIKNSLCTFPNDFFLFYVVML